MRPFKNSAPQQPVGSNLAAQMGARTLWLAAAVMASCSVLPSASSLAQDSIGTSSSDDETLASISREEWRQRVQEAKQRAREAAIERRNHPELYVPVPEDPELSATERVLNDESLQQGDIVATKRGLFVFRGRSDQPRREDDFVPVPPR